MALPEWRKPTLAGAGSLEVITMLARKDDAETIAQNLHDRQAAHIVSRFPVSMPMARVVAEHAFGRPA